MSRLDCLHAAISRRGLKEGVQILFLFDRPTERGSSGGHNTVFRVIEAQPTMTKLVENNKLSVVGESRVKARSQFRGNRNSDCIHVAFPLFVARKITADDGERKSARRGVVSASKRRRLKLFDVPHYFWIGARVFRPAPDEKKQREGEKSFHVSSMGRLERDLNTAGGNSP